MRLWIRHAQHPPLEAPGAKCYKLHHHTLQRLRVHLLNTSGLESVSCDIYPQTRKGRIPKHVIQTHHAFIPAAKLLGALILPSVNAHLSPGTDKLGFRPGHSTIFAFLQLTTDIAKGFYPRTQPDQTVCVAVDLTVAYDTVCILICYPRSQDPQSHLQQCIHASLEGDRCDWSSTRPVHVSIQQGSKLSPSLFSFYIADIPTLTESVKRVSYTDVIPELENHINSYMREMSTFLQDISLLISVSRSTVTLFTPDSK